MKDEIVSLLKSHKEPVSGEDICKYFHMSRAGIWKHVQDLRNDGYEIEAIPHKGYRFVSAPDKLLPREIKSGLQTKKLGKEIIYFDSVPSTMDVTFRMGLSNEKEGFVVCAEEQTKGKGRLGRKWASPREKGIYASVLLRPNLPIAEIAKLTLMSAVAICETLKKVTVLPAMIKWPNDILVQKRKIAGILTEINAEMDQVHFVVIGMGLNVNTPLSQLPEHGTSLKHESGSSWNRVKLFQEILLSLENWYTEVKEHGFQRMIARWKELSCTIGSSVVFHDAQGEVKGEAVDIDELGRLIIKDSKGNLISKVSGDVVQSWVEGKK